MSTEKEAADRIDVSYVANLARMELTEEERARFQGQLEPILEYFRQLRGVNVDGVEPTAHATRVQNVFRPDVVRPGLEQGRVMANAPVQGDGQFIVPKIVE